MDNELIERLKNITSLTLADMRNPEKIGIMLAAINDAIQRIEELEKMAVKTVSAFDHMLDEKDRRIEELEAALHYYADDHKNPNEGPWGNRSDDFGDVARAALYDHTTTGENDG